MAAGSTNYSTIEWSFVKSNRLAETSSSDGTNATWVAGLDEAAGRAKCVWDSTQIPDTDATTVDAGDSVTLYLYAGDSGKFYTMTALIESLTVTSNARSGAVEFEISFKSSGAVTDPVT